MRAVIGFHSFPRFLPFRMAIRTQRVRVPALRAQ
jgi:hypothetical protein